MSAVSGFIDLKLARPSSSSASTELETHTAITNIKALAKFFMRGAPGYVVVSIGINTLVRILSVPPHDWCIKSIEADSFREKYRDRLREDDQTLSE